MFGGPSVGSLNSLAVEKKRDFGRLCKALLEIDKIKQWEMADFIQDLIIRVEYGIPPELIFLCRLEGIGKTHAARLYNMGVREVSDITVMADQIEGTEDIPFIDAVKKALLFEKFRRKSQHGAAR